jgi:hypothetical protein
MEPKRLRVSVEKPEGKRPLERLSSRWENKIKMDLRVIAWKSLQWMH